MSRGDSIYILPVQASLRHITHIVTLPCSLTKGFLNGGPISSPILGARGLRVRRQITHGLRIALVYSIDSS